MLCSVFRQSSLFNKHMNTFEPSFVLALRNPQSASNPIKRRCTYPCPKVCKQLYLCCCQRDSRMLCSLQQHTQAVKLRTHTIVLNAEEKSL